MLPVNLFDSFQWVCRKWWVDGNAWDGTATKEADHIVDSLGHFVETCLGFLFFAASNRDFTHCLFFDNRRVCCNLFTNWPWCLEIAFITYKYRSVNMNKLLEREHMCQTYNSEKYNIIFLHSNVWFVFNLLRLEYQIYISWLKDYDRDCSNIFTLKNFLAE